MMAHHMEGAPRPPQYDELMATFRSDCSSDSATDDVDTDDSVDEYGILDNGSSVKDDDEEVQLPPSPPSSPPTCGRCLPLTAPSWLVRLVAAQLVARTARLPRAHLLAETPFLAHFRPTRVHVEVGEPVCLAPSTPCSKHSRVPASLLVQVLGAACGLTCCSFVWRTSCPRTPPTN